jgi:hypothetical protein
MSIIRFSPYSGKTRDAAKQDLSGDKIPCIWFELENKQHNDNNKNSWNYLGTSVCLSI